MSAAVAELTAEVSKSGNCLLREVYLGDAKHVIKHSWRLHILEVALTTTLLVDSKSHRAKNSKMAYAENSHLALGLEGEEMTESVLKNTREMWNKQQQQQQQQPRGSSSSSSRSRRRNADNKMLWPIIGLTRPEDGPLWEGH